MFIIQNEEQRTHSLPLPKWPGSVNKGTEVRRITVEISPKYFGRSSNRKIEKKIVDGGAIQNGDMLQKMTAYCLLSQMERQIKHTHLKSRLQVALQ